MQTLVGICPLKESTMILLGTNATKALLLLKWSGIGGNPCISFLQIIIVALFSDNYHLYE